MLYSTLTQAKSNETFILTALNCEAKPLIDYFGLKKNHNICAFPLYQNPDLKLTLVVSGVGIISAAAATAFAAAYLSDAPVCFVNIGIAGAFDIEIGALRLVNKVSNEAGKTLYPMGLSYFKLQSAALITHHQPAQTQPNTLVDMEGFSFYQTASRFTTLELIHALKIISDNQQQGVEQINAHQVKAWIEQHLETIDSFLMHLSTLAGIYHLPYLKENKLLNTLSKQFHITQYQRFQVKKLLPKIVAFSLENQEITLRAQCRSIKEWLANIQTLLQDYSLNFFTASEES